jgi:hypothetical protein
LLAINEESIGTYEPYLINPNGTEPGTWDLPFVPAFKYSGYLDNMTQGLNVTHKGNERYTNLYLHNGHAHLALKKTYQALVNNSDSTTKRPLLFTEASWSGSGAFGVGMITDIFRCTASLTPWLMCVVLLDLTVVTTSKSFA